MSSGDSPDMAPPSRDELVDELEAQLLALRTREAELAREEAAVRREREHLEAGRAEREDLAHRLATEQADRRRAEAHWETERAAMDSERARWIAEEAAYAAQRRELQARLGRTLRGRLGARADRVALLRRLRGR